MTDEATCGAVASIPSDDPWELVELWCELPAGHAGEHVTTLGDDEPVDGQTITVQEGRGEPVAHLTGQPPAPLLRVTWQVVPRP